MENCPLVESTLDEVCSLVTDGTHDTPKRVTSGFPLIKAKEITGGRIDFASCDQISPEEHRKVIERSKPELGDTLFAHIGASLGEAAFVDTRREFSIKNIALFKPNTKIINPRYLYYVVTSPIFQASAKAAKTGSAQPFLSLGHLRRHRLSYHSSLKLQQKVVSCLAAYDELIANNQRRIQILEEMARGLYREWFVHFRFPGYENHPRVPSAIGDIPQTWDIRQIDQVTSFISRGIAPAYDENGDSLVLNQKCIRSQRISLDPARKQSKKVPEKKILRYGDVLINSTGVGTLGRTAQVHSRINNATVDSHVTIVRPTELVDSAFFGCSLLQQEPEFERLGVGATGQTELSRASIGGVRIIYPPIAMQRKFGAVVSPINEAAICYASQIENLRQTRDLLLPRLLSGQINLEIN